MMALSLLSGTTLTPTICEILAFAPATDPNNSRTAPPGNPTFQSDPLSAPGESGRGNTRDGIVSAS
jgi:hypothetical protein